MQATDDTITILYDAFGHSSRLIKDWGFAALIRYRGLQILFDTGNNADIFAHNTHHLGIDLAALDFTVISHRHGDHTSGINHLLKANPEVTLYTPKEAFGVFGASLDGTFYRCDCSLPTHMRYFDGCAPDTIPCGTPWEQANFVWLDTATEIAPGVHAIYTLSDVPGTRELPELSLGFESPKGLVLVVGCSHPGIEKILTAASGIEPRIHAVFGGFHLLNADDTEIARIAQTLKEQWQIQYMAPGHCTGEPMFAELRKRFAGHYAHAGLGEQLNLA